jgi:hypothetical protein
LIFPQLRFNCNERDGFNAARGSFLRSRAWGVA